MRGRRTLATRNRLAGLLSLALCVSNAGGAEPGGNAQALPSEIASILTKPGNSLPSTERPAPTHKMDTVTEDPDLRYYPLAKYRKYPETVRSLIRRADMEDDRCRGIFDNETLRACNRREWIMVELENKGWCWGGADVGYLEHWLKCADDPYRPRNYRRTIHLYSEKEIAESANHAGPPKP